MRQFHIPSTCPFIGEGGVISKRGISKAFSEVNLRGDAKNILRFLAIAGIEEIEFP
jgi:hypothetical protein